MTHNAHRLSQKRMVICIQISPNTHTFWHDSYVFVLPTCCTEFVLSFTDVVGQMCLTQ